LLTPGVEYLFQVSLSVLESGEPEEVTGQLQRERKVEMRKKWVVALVVVVCVGVWGAVGEGFDVSSWQKMGKEIRLGYVIGYYDGFLSGSVVQEMYPKKTNEFSNKIKAWNYGQNIAIIDKYLKDNPHKWHESFAILVLDAYEDACKKSGFYLRPSPDTTE
jgi:hypothetical protein